MWKSVRTYFLLCVCIAAISSIGYAQIQEEFNSLKTNWQNQIKQGDFRQLFEDQYLTGSLFWHNIKYYDSEQDIINALDRISDQFDKGRFDSFSLYKHDSANYFEVGRFERDDGIPIFFLIGWQYINGNWIRELDLFIDNTVTQCSDIGGVEVARNKWMKLANEHNPENLVNNSYTYNAIYFSNGKLTMVDQLAKRYKYMSNQDWKIELEAYDVMVVQEGLILEIGEYRAKSKGLYLIIWQKQENKKWKVLLDFNF